MGVSTTVAWKFICQWHIAVKAFLRVGGWPLVGNYPFHYLLRKNAKHRQTGEKARAHTYSLQKTSGYIHTFSGFSDGSLLNRLLARQKITHSSASSQSNATNIATTQKG
jgi:hypothetical protein